MKTNLVLLGSATATLGALGLIFFGGSIVGIYETLTLNFTEPSSTFIHDVLSDLRIATVSGIALTLGLACACYGISKENSTQTQSRTRRYLHRVSAILLIIGTLPVLNAIRHVYRDFARFATSGADPVQMTTLAEAAILTVTSGCIILAAGTALLLVATLAGPKVTSGQDSELRTLRTGFAAKGSVLLGIIITFLLVAIHSNANQLEAIARTPRANPAEFASQFMAIWNKSLYVFIGLSWQGILQGWVRRIKPALEPDVSKPELTDATPPEDE
jgi:hypothetical protein